MSIHLVKREENCPEEGNVRGNMSRGKYLDPP